ncbi:MAG: glutathione S-transferase family protein [Parvularculaceae bacterium]
MPQRPVLYHCPRTRSAITNWMNEELGAPAEIKLINLKAGDHKKPDYVAMNPMGKAPMLTHDGVVVTEAAAICAYLADAYAEKNLAPAPGDPKRGAYFRWLFFSPGCIEPTMLDKFAGIVRENPASVGHGLQEDVLAAIDTALENSPYLLGDQFTAADVVFGSTLHFATMFGVFEKKPNYQKYLDRLHARPAFQAAQAKDEKWAQEMGLNDS